MIDADNALGHHFFKITKTERIGHISSHAQQHHIQRTMKPPQNLGNACRKRLSRCRGLLHRGPKQSVGAPNFTAASLLLQDPVFSFARDTGPLAGSHGKDVSMLKVLLTKNPAAVLPDIAK